MSQRTDAFEKAPESKATEFDASNFLLFVYQPVTSFYYLSFDERLALLTQNIKMADKLYKEANLPASANGLFVAPEYLFKDFSKEGSERYYSHEEKKRLVQRICELSKETKLIIVPGTICWHKHGNKKGSPFNFFRNSAYLFHQGTLQKYKKRHLAMSDQDYKRDSRHVFIEGKNDSPIKTINALTLGIEICLDNNFEVVESQSKKVDIHLVIANRLVKPQIPKQHGPLFIKIDFRPGYTSLPKYFPTEIGALKKTLSSKTSRIKFERAICASELGDLFCYRFLDNPTLSMFDNQSLPPSCQLPTHEYIRHIQKCLNECGLSDLQPTTIKSVMKMTAAGINQYRLIEADFPRHFFDLKAAGLLTDENVMTLMRSPAYATSYTRALIEMKRARLLTPEMNKLLNQNIDKALNLKNFILLLHHSGHLNDEVALFFHNNSKKIMQFKKQDISDAYAIFYELIALKIFKIKYLVMMFYDLKKNKQTKSVLTGIIMLVSARLYNKQRAQVIFKNKSDPDLIISYCDALIYLHDNPLCKKAGITFEAMEELISRDLSQSKAYVKLLTILYVNFPDEENHLITLQNFNDARSLIAIIDVLLKIHFFKQVAFLDFINYMTLHHDDIRLIKELILDLYDIYFHTKAFNKKHVCAQLIKHFCGDKTISSSFENMNQLGQKMEYITCLHQEILKKLGQSEVAQISEKQLDTTPPPPSFVLTR